VDLEAECTLWPEDGTCSRETCAVAACCPRTDPFGGRAPAAADSNDAASASAASMFDDGVDVGDPNDPDGAGPGARAAAAAAGDVWGAHPSAPWAWRGGDGDDGFERGGVGSGRPDPEGGWAEVNLDRNPERYTGYVGEHPHRMWAALWDAVGSAPALESTAEGDGAGWAWEAPEAARTARAAVAARAAGDEDDPTTTRRSGAGSGGDGWAPHPPSWAPAWAGGGLDSTEDAFTGAVDPSAVLRRLLSGVQASINVHIAAHHLVSSPPPSPSDSFSSSPAPLSERAPAWGERAEVFLDRVARPGRRWRWGNLEWTWLFALRAAAEAARPETDGSRGARRPWAGWDLPGGDAASALEEALGLDVAATGHDAAAAAEAAATAGLLRRLALAATEEEGAECPMRDPAQMDPSSAQPAAARLARAAGEAAAALGAPPAPEALASLSAAMDCVGCGRCRLWGKLQALGLGASLKVHFPTLCGAGESPPPLAPPLAGAAECDEVGGGGALGSAAAETSPPPHIPPLSRGEAVALLQLLGRLGDSVAAARGWAADVARLDAADAARGGEGGRGGWAGVPDTATWDPVLRVPLGEAAALDELEQREASPFDKGGIPAWAEGGGGFGGM